MTADDNVICHHSTVAADVALTGTQTFDGGFREPVERLWLDPQPVTLPPAVSTRKATAPWSSPAPRPIPVPPRSMSAPCNSATVPPTVPCRVPPSPTTPRWRSTRQEARILPDRFRTRFSHQNRHRHALHHRPPKLHRRHHRQWRHTRVAEQHRVRGLSPRLMNAGFETPDYSGGGLELSWTMTGCSAAGASPTGGIGSNGSPLLSTAPVGDQAGFIQFSGTISQTITVADPGEYGVTFESANRPGYGATNLLRCRSVRPRRLMDRRRTGLRRSLCHPHHQSGHPDGRYPYPRPLLARLPREIPESPSTRSR